MALNSKKLVDGYMNNDDWRVKENSNSPWCFGGLNKYTSAEVLKDYALRNVYTEEIAQAYVNGDIHIHDLGGGTHTLYCCGYSLKTILTKGVGGVKNIPASAPAKHFDSILNQISNLGTVLQNEVMGAIAFNSFDTLLAPFIKVDKLTYSQVYQSMQNFIYTINSNSRAGAEPAFTNITFDLTPPNDLLNEYAIVGGEQVNFTYGSCQQEIDMLNRAFYEIMLKGDYEGKLFSYPIPTYNIHERFDWDNPNNKLLWELTGKYGVPYFANFLNSDLSIEDVRSMCCRLSLSLSEIRKRNGGLFGAGDATGSVGVTTINLARIGYLAQTEDELFNRLYKSLVLAKESLEIKRKHLNDNIVGKGFIPAFDYYVGTINNHFSTIGVIGMNEMCLNFFGKDIISNEGKSLCISVGNFINKCLVEFQEETENLYNYEATPAESVCYRLALLDKKQFPNIITQGSGKGVYYTNSCHIPVNQIKSIKETFDHQESLQVQFSGGTVIHIYLNSSITGTQAKHIIKTVCERYKTPYVSLSPISRYCMEHGYIEDVVTKCPICKQKLKIYQRITGYLRCVDNFNNGKASEFNNRVQINIEAEYGDTI